MVLNGLRLTSENCENKESDGCTWCHNESEKLLFVKYKVLRVSSIQKTDQDNLG